MSQKILPDCLPLHQNSQTELFELSIDDDLDFLKISGQEMLTTINQIIDCSNIKGLNPIELIKSLEVSQKNVIKQNEQMQSSKERLNEARNKYKRDSTNFLKKNKDWYSNVANMNNTDTISSQLSTLYEQSATDSSDTTTVTNERRTSNNMTEKDQTDKINEILRVLPYIIKDPTSVIPDVNDTDNAENDELEIEGGNIELICPITFKTYQKPMISKKCGHVFDYDGLMDYFQNNSIQIRDCPQAACGKKLEIKDFELDDIMVLRCKLAKIKEVQEEASKNEEALDVL